MRAWDVNFFVVDGRHALGEEFLAVLAEEFVVGIQHLRNPYR
jgi:hypothetical protein